MSTLAATEFTPAQQAWLDLEYGMFIHFGINTYVGCGWGDGKADIARFAPTALDTDQWADVAVEAGMRYAVLTTKHHDGFCLWPSAQTEYCVRNAGIKHDVVERFVTSFRRRGLKVGLYYSLWDMHYQHYDDDAAYHAYMIAQITELLTRYGDCLELWFDGGWDKDYPTRKPNWDPAWAHDATSGYTPGTRWDWAGLYKHIKRLQPDCLVIQNSSSERPGQVKYLPQDISTAEHFHFVHHDRLCEPPMSRHIGERLLPLEYCASLNPHWFHVTPSCYAHPSVATIRDWQLTARAAQGNLLLNVGPDQSGRIPEVHRAFLCAAAT